MPLYRFLPLSGLILLCLLMTGPGEMSAQYSSTWANAPIGGGGRTTGFIASPSSDRLYLRTDVAGFYGRSVTDASWTRLVESFTPDLGRRMQGTAGLAVHPTDPDLLYMAINEGIFKTTDYGQTWAGPVLNVRVNSNGSSYGRNDRQYGEALVIDQYNGEVVYYGSQEDGLFYSRDGGATWTNIPAGQLPTDGSRSVVVDNTRGHVDVGTPLERAKYVYVSVRNKGLYRSEDGGTTFSQWEAVLPGGGSYVRWLRQASNGDLFAAHEKGLARWNGSVWTDISAAPGSEHTTVTVDKTNPARLMTFAEGEIRRSTDAGNSWSVVDYVVGDLPPWAGGRYEPGQPETFVLYLAYGKLYVCSNYHAWESTTDIWDGSPVTFDAMYEGNEMTINITGVSLPEGRASYIAGMADIRGFKFEDLTQYPTQRLTIPANQVAAGFFTPNFTGIDFCEAEPDEIWFVSSKKPGYVPLVFRSSDAGDVVNYVSNPSAGTPWEGESGGGPKIAVSATHADTAVVLIRNHVRYTHDGGQTWNTSANIDGQPGLLQRTIEYDFDHLLLSDRVNGNKFYIYTTDGKFWRSEDGGVSFDESTSASADLPDRRWLQGGNDSGQAGGVMIAAAPGLEGELLLALSASGIWRSSGTGVDKTNNFSEITFFSRINPTTVSYGAPLPGASLPTAYVYGQRRVDGLWGVWLSTDLGDTWELASPINNPGQWSRKLTGDRTTPGRVFMADASYGVRYLTVDVDDAPVVEDLIIDNDEPGYSARGAWAAATFQPGGEAIEGNNYRVNRTNDATAYARYQPNIQTAGSYNVYGRWTSNARRAQAVVYEVTSAEGVSTKTVSQRENGGEWVLLGTYEFATGTSGRVDIKNDPAGGLTIADAVRWEYVIVDNSLPLRPSGFGATLPSFDRAELTWFDNASNEAGFLLERAIGSGPFTTLATLAADVIAYTDNTIQFPERYRYRLSAFNPTGSSTVIEVEVDNSEIIVDNSDLDAIEQVGNWIFRTSTFGGQYIGDNFQVDGNSGKGVKSFTWKTDIPLDGVYAVYGRWQRGINRPLDVPYEVTHAGGKDTIRVNQRNRQLGGRWNLLGQYIYRTNAQGRVTVYTTGTVGEVSIDAVRWTYEGEIPPLGAPTELVAARSGVDIRLSWLDNADFETGYVVERRADGGTFFPIATLPANTATYTDTDLTPGTGYAYRVVAIRSGDLSEPSNVACIAAPYLQVLLKNTDSNNPNFRIRQELRLVNLGSQPAPMDELTVRYWFTSENHGTLRSSATFGNTSTEFVRVADPRVGANWYMELGFLGGEIAPGAFNRQRFQINKNNYLDFDESDDHSYEGVSSFVEATGVTVYRNGELIWGEEPDLAPIEDLALSLLYRENRNPTGGPAIEPYFELLNTSNQGVDLDRVTMRYWMTIEALLTEPQFYATRTELISRGFISGAFTPLNPAREAADHYVEISFRAEAGELHPFSTTGLIKSRIQKRRLTNMIAENDYSYLHHTELDFNDRVTVYVDGNLVWGVEPGSAAAARTAVLSDPAFPNVGIRTTAAADLAVFPNPVTVGGALQLSSIEGAGALTEFRIVELATGRTIALPGSAFTSGSNSLSLRELSLTDGVYVLSAYAEDLGRFVSARFIVR